ncbi:MAG: helix-turn-helix transcriptional regulator [Clostridiales bacterium]|jgi:DNA-binding Xre family transcriptional regulator|nr:helix-turn-helix transcriptional regulator [Clostridiales bacterium]
MRTANAVAIRLQKLLSERDMSQYALCKKVAIDPSNLYNIFYGRCKTVTLDKLYLLAEGLDMTVQEFLTDPIFDKTNIEAD